MRAYADDGLSAGAAAKKMGITRNAAVGAGHRLNIHFHSRPAPRPRLGMPKAPPKPPREAIEPTAVASPPETSLSVPLEDLRDDQCRWPDPGETKPFTYCGQPAVSRRVPYCADHVATKRSATQPTWKP